MGAKENGDELVARADAILRGDSKVSATDAFELAIALSGVQQFGRARKLLRRARDGKAGDGSSLPADARTKARQKYALCTYKDPDIPVSGRLRKALEILGEDGEDLSTTSDQETLGLAGAICKRRWEATTRISDLEESLAYYLRGYAQGLDDDGYTAINAAFVLDLLTDAESNGPGSASSGDAGDAPRRQAADEIRALIVARLKGKATAETENWWLHATLGEACLGIGNYGDAAYWLSRHMTIAGLPEWQLESTARQIGALCNLRARNATGKLDPGATAALEVLAGGDEEAITTAYAGKVGIALSGGGFRASFFHIGVLARLAELGMLRHVEVLSCVSGGSIVGAHYYLEVQRLLETKADSEIEDRDYAEIVTNLERRFIAGVGKNIRMRVMGNPWSNLKAIFWSGWTRTRQAGKAFERHLYKGVAVGRDPNERQMEDLLIGPKDEDRGRRGEDGRPTFRPARDNWRRRCKVPILVLNATSLNTGHNWQFTASWMGEPPAVVDEDIDANPRLRRMYYSEAPKRWRRVRLGEAVAASACVPGLFEPLTLNGLFEDMSVALVDGGVHDNQGVASLVEQECSVALISDASGQMECKDRPGRDPLSAPLRSSSVLAARVREAQLRDLLARRSSSALRGLMLVHLRKGLAEPPRDWIDAPDTYNPADDVAIGGERPADYGVPREVQRLLAGIRTDLDTFSEIEAKALVLSGYEMTKVSYAESGIAGFPPGDAGEHAWEFQAVAAAVRPGGSGHQRLTRVLAVGAGRWLKVWRLNRVLTVVGAVVALVLLAGALYLLWLGRDLSILTPGALLAVIAALALVGLARKLILKRLEPGGLLARVGIGVVLVAATPLAWLQVALLDRLYKRAGRIGAS